VAEALAPTLMLQGATSSAGKTYLAAGLCRVYHRRGLRVAPFKAQNMALNSAVTPDGAEIGRAQAVQAEAARVPAEAGMNPVLLKAEADSSCQVVLMGRPIGVYSAAAYRDLRAELWPTVAAALADLRSRFDLVVIEGAGSPAEVNLREGEIVNMRVAAAAQAPVLLVADIERGGVFAALLGTLDLLEPDERALVRGLLVNRFRGDPTLFDGGVDFLQRRSGLPVVGVVPYLDVRLPAEDSLELDLLRGEDERAGGALLDVAVVHLGRISNFDELQPLAGEPAVRLRLVSTPHELGRPDLVVLPGTKTTVADLGQLRESGLADAILDARSAGAAVLGICGGYQMLGEEISDPDGVESPGAAPGMGLLPVRTVFERTKVTAQRRATVIARPGLLGRCAGLRVPGYEVHMGRVLGDRHPAFELDGGTEGSVSDDGWVVGTSLHGLLGDHRFRRGLLEGLAERKDVALPPPSAAPPDPFDRLADALERCLDVGALDRMVGLP